MFGTGSQLGIVKRIACIVCILLNIHFLCAVKSNCVRLVHFRMLVCLERCKGSSTPPTYQPWSALHLQ